MGDLSIAIRLWKIVVFLLLASTVAFAQLLPLSREAGGFPGPDLLFLMAAAWVMRRPRLIPIWVFLVVFLIADVLFMRPLGLHAALTLIGLDMLRRRASAQPMMPLLREWALVSFAATAITLLETVILAVFLVPQAALGLALIRLIFTVLAYPLVLLVVARPFGLTRPRSNDKDLIVGRLA